MKLRVLKTLFTCGSGLACLIWYLLLLVMVCTPWLLNSAAGQSAILRALSGNLPENVTISTFQVSMLPRPRLEVDNLDLNLGPVQAKIPKLTLTPRLVPLLWGQISPASVHLSNPRLKLQELTRHLTTAQGQTPSRQSLLSRLPEPMAVTVHQGALTISTTPEQAVSMDKVQAEIRLGQTTRITASCTSALWQDLFVELQTDVQSLSTTGRFSIQELRSDKVADTLNIPSRWRPGQKGLSLEGTFAFSDPDHARLDLQAFAHEVTLSRQDRELIFSNPDLIVRADVTPEEYSLQVDRLSFDAPEAALSGQMRFERSTNKKTLFVQGEKLDIAGLRQRCRILFAEVKPVQEVLDIVQAGVLSDMAVSSSGKTLKQIAKNVKLKAVLNQGRVVVPEPKLDLTDIQGTVTINKNILTGREFSASLNQARALNGTMSMALNRHVRPFSMETDITGPAAQIPPILRQSVKSRPFLQELARVSGVQGTITGTLRLNRDQDHPMQVSVQARELDIRARYAPLPFAIQASGGRFEYTETALSGQGIELEFGQSRIQDLAFELALKPSLDLEYDLRGADLNWQELFPWLAGSDFCRTNLPGLNSVNGSARLGSMSFAGPPGALAQCTYRAQGQIQDLVLHQEGLPGPVHLDSGSFDLQPGKIQLDRCKIRFLDAQGRLDGWVATRADRKPSFELSFEGNLGRRAGEWVMNRAELPQAFKLQTPMKIQGSRIARSADRLELRLKALVNDTVHMDLDLVHDADSLHRATLDLQDQDSRASLAFSASEDTCDVSFAGTLAKSSLDRLLQDNRYLQGTVQGDFTTTFNPQPFQIVSASGPVRITQLLPVPEFQHFKVIDLKIMAESTKLVLEKGQLKLGQDEVSLVGTVFLKETASLLELSLSSGELHWDELNRVLSRLKTLRGGASRQPGSDPALSMTLQARIDCFDFHGLSWCPLQAEVNVSPRQTVRVKISDSRLCTMDTPGSFVVKAEGSQAQFYPSARDRDLGTALKCLFGKQDLMTGRYDLSGQLSSQGGLGTGDWQGSVNFLARNGRIQRFNLLGKILGFLNSTEILFGTFPDIDQEGLGYHELSIRSRVKDGLLILDQGRLDGESIEMGFQGHMNLKTREVNLDVLVAPLKTVDRLIKKIPVVSGLMGGNLISIPVKVTGTFSEPQVRPLSPDSVSTELKNMMKKALNLPMQIIRILDPNSKSD